MSSIKYPYETKPTKQILFSLISDGSGDASQESKLIQGVIQRVIITPGAGVSANFTVAIFDERGMDVLQSDANAGIICSSATEMVELRPHTHVTDVLTCTIAGLATEKTYEVAVYWTED